jgi:uncharacterized protein involved in outer membrane biogenesis
VLFALCVIVLLAAGLVLPPLININRYQRRITELIARSLGRPVRLSSVELRLLPMPGFVLHDLSVSENAAFGAEPILSARTVVATVAIWPLWRGKLQISRISVDEASLNLVRTAQGSWNLETLMTGPAQPALTGANLQAQNKTVQFPYLEATNSRVNLKKGLEKTPYSLVNTDLSLWQEQPGEWRVRLRGEPLRSDLSVSREADSGTGQLRLEARLRSAAQLRAMPLHLEAEWRDAQLGQLSRLLLGSDAGWRGDLTADVQIDGNAEAAQTQARLRATGVRREEFAPETPLDFDANCSFQYQHSRNAFRKVSCDTAIGSGRLHVKGDFPGRAAEGSRAGVDGEADAGAGAEAGGEQAEAMLEVSAVPVQAALDLMRTMRSGFAPGIQARGTVNGSLSYRGRGETETEPAKAAKSPGRKRTTGTRIAGARTGGKTAQAVPKLQGSLIADGVQLRGGGLKDAIALPKMTWTPAMLEAVTGDGLRTGIESRVTFPIGPGKAKTESKAESAANGASSPEGAKAGAGAPDQAPGTESAAGQSLTMWLGVTRGGYRASLSGSGSPEQLRSMAYAMGIPPTDAANGFAGGTAGFDLAMTGPWVAPALSRSSLAVSGEDAGTEDRADLDTITGTMQLKRTRWQAPYLARTVELPQANVAFSANGVDLESDFAYGAVNGAVNGEVAIHAPYGCKAPECEPQVELRFGALDAAVVEAALEGGPQQKSLLSPLVERMPKILSKDAPALPQVALSVTADSLLLGPVTLRKPVVRFECKGAAIAIESLDAGMLGGTLHLTGSGERQANGVPLYSFEGSLTQAGAAEVGEVLGGSWSGGPISLTGKVQLAGLSSAELASSAKGTVKFDWKRGAVAGATPQLAKFGRWSGDVTIAEGSAVLGANEVVSERGRGSAEGAMRFAEPVQAKAASVGDASRFVFGAPAVLKAKAGGTPPAAR